MNSTLQLHFMSFIFLFHATLVTLGGRYYVAWGHKRAKTKKKIKKKLPKGACWSCSNNSKKKLINFSITAGLNDYL